MTFGTILLLSAGLAVYYGENPKSTLHPIFGRLGWHIYALVCAVEGLLILGAF